MVPPIETIWGILFQFADMICGVSVKLKRVHKLALRNFFLLYKSLSVVLRKTQKESVSSPS